MMFTVSDLLKNKGAAVWSVQQDTTTQAALDLLAEKNVGALLVMDDARIAGIISERDIVRRISANHNCQLDAPVKEIMTAQVITVRPNQTIEECMKLMTQKHIRHLPVTDENDRLVGLISIGDVVKTIIYDQDWTIHALETYIQGGKL